jgi:uncharacterized protein YccT (UPF0319 family)
MVRAMVKQKKGQQERGLVASPEIDLLVLNGTSLDTHFLKETREGALSN